MIYEEPVGAMKKRSFVLLGGAIVLGLLVGLGIGVMVGGEAEADTALPAEVQKAHDDWYAAWNAADGEAVTSMMAFGGRHYCPGTGGDGAAGDELAKFVETGHVIADITTVGSTTMNSPGETSGASQDHVVVAEISVDGHAGYVSVLHLRGAEDSLQILSHRAFP